MKDYFGFKLMEKKFLNKGIYKISCLKNNKIYIGSTIQTIRRRLRRHINNLNKNKHHNQHLQNAWNLYGGESFEFEVVEIIENIDLIRDRETYWISFFDSFKNGFNKYPCGDSPQGSHRSEEEKINIGKRSHLIAKYRSQEEKERISNVIKQAMKDSVWHFSQESRKRISEARRSKKRLTKEQVIEIKILLTTTELTDREIALKFKVHPTCINNIKRGKSHKNIIINIGVQ